MFTTFAPSALTPPSANTKLWVASTTASTRHASQGPSRTVASAAPRKWPLVPPATGKLSICAAKTNAPVTPSSGTTRSSSRAPARRRPTPTAPAATTAVAAATSGDRNPSGMCMVLLSGWRAHSGQARRSGSGRSRWRSRWRRARRRARRERAGRQRRMAAAALARGVAGVAAALRARTGRGRGRRGRGGRARRPRARRGCGRRWRCRARRRAPRPTAGGSARNSVSSSARRVDETRMPRVRSATTAAVSDGAASASERWGTVME